MPENRLNEFIDVLSCLSSETWNGTVTAGAGWKWMKPFSKKWAFGHFATLFIMLGLNDYQTKGKAETGYWPKVVPLIPLDPEPKEPQKIIDLLNPFFSKERMAKVKVERLKRFLGSHICKKVWSSDSALIAAKFGEIWRTVGLAMGQHPQKKTIAFGMKCLALALLMVDETRFDYSSIPVPVDSRIRSLSERLGLPVVTEDAERARWKAVLDRIRALNPKITMVHLDSLLWQIGTLSQRQMQTHLQTLGAGELAVQISELFSTATNYYD